MAAVARGARPGRPRVVAEAQPQRDGAPRPAGRPHAPGDAVNQRHEDRVEGRGRSRRAAEGALGTERAPAAAAAHRPGIAVVREGVQVAARRPPDHRDELGLAQRGDLADGRDPAARGAGRRSRGRRPRAAPPRAARPSSSTRTRSPRASRPRFWIRASPALSHRPGARPACPRQRARGTGGTRCPRRLLCRRSPHDPRDGAARGAGTGASTTTAFGATVGRSAGRSSTSTPKSRHACCPRPRRRTTSHCGVSRKSGAIRSRSSTRRATRSAPLRRPVRHRPGRSPNRPLLRTRAPDQDASAEARRRPGDRRGDYPVERSVYAMRNVDALRRQPRPPARSSAATPPRCSIARCPGRACGGSTRCWASCAGYGAPRVTDGLHRRPRGRHAGRPSTQAHARTGHHGGAGPTTRPHHAAAALSPARDPVRAAAPARHASEGEESQ